MFRRMEGKSFSISVSPRRDSVSQCNSIPFFSLASLAIRSCTERRKGRVMSLLPFTIICMSAYSRKEQFLYSLWHRDHCYPLHCICELQPVKNWHLKYHNYLCTSWLSLGAKSFWNIPKLIAKDCNWESESSDNINFWTELHMFRYRNIICNEKSEAIRSIFHAVLTRSYLFRSLYRFPEQ